jgi:glutamyl-tRNA reductase
VNVDELSKLKDETLRSREAEVPKAKDIIAESIMNLLNGITCAGMCRC